MSRRKREIAGIAAAALLLAGLGGCGIRQAMGPQKYKDEYSIQTNRPLVLPPSYDLKPPAPGQKGTSGPSADARAQQTLFGSGPAAAPASESTGESALLQRAGAAQANPDIRQQVNAETAQVSDRGPGMTDRVLDWNPPATAPQGTAQPAAPTPEQADTDGLIGPAAPQ